MFTFRQPLPLWGVFLLALAAPAQQVPALTCTGNAGVPPIVRSEGLTEYVGDLVLNCKGGTPPPVGRAIPQANIQIFLNTNVTSRLTNDPWSEALLLIDEPAPGAQRYCSQNGGCPATAGDVNPPNIFHARQAGANSLAWLGVPVDPPGPTATRVLRITNVRANANQLGVATTLIPTQIVMFVSVTGTTSIPINNPQQTVAFILPGLTFSGGGGSYLQCTSVNPAAATDPSKTLTDGLGAYAIFTEGFASAFKPRSASAFVDSDTSPIPVNQNVPGAIYNTESGFYNSTPGAGKGLNLAGLADHGTRLTARISNMPAGVTLYAALYPLDNSPKSRARLISSAATPFAPVSATNGASFGGPTAPVNFVNGSATLVWEVLDADPLTIQTFMFGIAISYVSNTANNLPGLGAATIAGSFAPLGGSAFPRFADTSTSQSFFTINACTTNLLFVFLTNQAGFDSGISIANTSVDPFGHAGQNGPCTLNYYGETTGGGAAPASQTSAVIPAGKQFTAVLSTGGNYGVAATPGFQGYMIAQCSFQYAHGCAFISDIGANRVSEAYLALILDPPMGARTLFTSEILGH